MASTPLYTGTVRASNASISTANTNRDGTGTLGTVITAGSSGTRIERVTITGTGSTTAGMVRLFVYDGTNTYLIKEQPVTAITPSATVAAFTTDITFGDVNFLVLPNGYSLKASTHNAEGFNVTAFGGDF